MTRTNAILRGKELAPQHKRSVGSLLSLAFFCAFLPLAGVAQGGTPPLPNINTSLIFDVTNTAFAGGALGNGVSNSAAAINAAITTASTASASGATVRILAVGVNTNYLSGPITMKNNVNLLIDAGTKLQMLPKASWPSTGTPLIFGNGIHDSQISGTGTIDGQYSTWGGVDPRPNFIEYHGSTRVAIQGVSQLNPLNLQNPPTFHIMVHNNNVSLTIQNIRINTPSNTANTDGIDLASTNVLIQGCFISDGDDNIQIGSSSALASDITISNCTFGTGHGVSIGSPTQSGINNLTVSNCFWSGTQYGIKIKTDRGIGGLIQNLKYTDLTMSNVNFAIAFYLYYSSLGSPSSSFSVTPFRASTDTVHQVTAQTPIIRNITISNLTATSIGGNVAGIIWGLPESLISNVTLTKVNMTAPTKTFDMYNASGIQIRDSNLTAPNTSTNTLTVYNIGLTVTNSATTNTTFTATGMNPTNGNNTLAVFGRPFTLNDTNVLGPNPLITLGNSKLTVSNSLKLGSASVLNFAIGTNLAQIAATGSLTASGTLNILDGGGLTNNSYTLITYGGGLTYNGLTLGSTPSTNFTFTINTNTSGQIKLDVIPATSFAQWQLQYFNCTNCPQAAGTNDFDGDGQINTTEFLAGTDPTNSASFWGIQATPTNGLAPRVVSFSENSTGLTITNRSWDFGDGSTGSGSNPSHTYTNAGTFSVSLTIFNYFGTATLVATNLITISPEAVWTNANPSGNWSSSTSWDPQSIPDGGAGAIFANAGTTAVVDTVSRTVGEVTFNRSGNFVVAASGGASLAINIGITVANTFTCTISAPLVLNSTNIWSVITNGILQVSSSVSGSNSITKTGGGIASLTGTNAYTGATIVSNGTLAIVGSGLITNTPSIDIATNATLDVSGCTSGSMTLISGQTLQGNGMIVGKLIMADGSTNSPGDNSVGTLTFLNDLIVSNAAVLQYDLGANSDLTTVASNLTLGGTLNINDAGGFGVGAYTLFTYGGALTYSGLSIGTTPSTNFLYQIDTNTAGAVKLDVTLLPTTVGIVAANLQDGSGALAPSNSIAVLVVDTGNNGFISPQPGFGIGVGAAWGPDDKVVAVWDLGNSINCSGSDAGALCAQAVVAYTNGIAPGQVFELYWFPSLTLASNTLGVTSYGKYTDPVGIDGSDVWQMPAGGSSLNLQFLTLAIGGSNPETAGQATFSTAVAAPAAGFTAIPANGVEPLTVTFTDTSTGSTPLALSWDFGDSSTTNTTDGAILTHIYPAGTYTVSLTASNSAGTSTLVSNNLIAVMTAFQGWQLQFFGCTNCPQAQANADPDGDGMSNTNEFLAGTNPTNSLSGLRIISATQQSTNVVITWTTAGGSSNAVQAAAGATGGNYSNNFSDISGVLIIQGSGDVTTNYTDFAGATNTPSRYYRVRLVP
jgi:polygalacturonase